MAEGALPAVGRAGDEDPPRSARGRQLQGWLPIRPDVDQCGQSGLVAVFRFRMIWISLLIFEQIGSCEAPVALSAIPCLDMVGATLARVLEAAGHVGTSQALSPVHTSCI